MVIVRCVCGRWLARIEVTGQPQVIHLTRCPVCRRRGHPSYPVAHVSFDGRVALDMMHAPVRAGLDRKAEPVVE